MKNETILPDIKATNWDDHWSTVSGTSLIEKWRIRSVWKGYERLLKRTSLPPDPQILELGAGSGHVSLRLIKKYGGSATLIEGNPRAIIFSKKLWDKAGLMNCVTHIEGSLLKTKLASRFDLAHSGGVIEHFHGRDKSSAIEAHIRPLKKSGYLILVIPVKSIRYSVFKAFLSLMGKWIYTDEIPWERDEAVKTLCPQGFRLVRQTRIGHETGYLLEKQID